MTKNIRNMSTPQNVEFTIQIELHDTNETLDLVANTIRNGIANMTKLEYKCINITVITPRQRRLLQIPNYITFLVVITSSVEDIPASDSDHVFLLSCFAPYGTGGQRVPGCGQCQALPNLDAAFLDAHLQKTESNTTSSATLLGKACAACSCAKSVRPRRPFGLSLTKPEFGTRGSTFSLLGSYYTRAWYAWDPTVRRLWAASSYGEGRHIASDMRRPGH